MNKISNCWNSSNWRSWFPILALFTLLWLVACSRGISQGGGGPEVTDEVGETPTATPALTKVAASEPAPTATALVISEATSSLSPTEEPTNVPATPKICSPLAIHPIVELPEIVSAEYDPPPPGKEERHQGVDFSYYRLGERSSILGVGVESVFPGQVACSVTESFPYGNMVIVETSPDQLPEELITSLDIADGESLYLLYAHLDGAPEVTLRDAVDACQPLGAVGLSGNAGVPHLHLEARVGPAGVKFEGMAYYSTQTTELERGNYETWRTSGAFRHVDPMEIFGD